MIRSMTRADLILIAGCLCFAVLLGILFVMHRRTGSMVTISYEGTELYRIAMKDLSSGHSHYYLITYREDGQDIHIMHFEQYPELPVTQQYNLFVVTDGIVTMEAADCRDQICVRHIPIENDRESIICLPHKLVVGISGGTNSDRIPADGNDADGGPEQEPDEKLDGVAG